MLLLIEAGQGAVATPQIYSLHLPSALVFQNASKILKLSRGASVHPNPLKKASNAAQELNLSFSASQYNPSLFGAPYATACMLVAMKQDTPFFAYTLNREYTGQK